MSEGFGLFGLLSQEWEWLSAGRSARLTVERWAREEPCLAGVGSLAEVVGLCHRRGDPGRSAVVLALLVRRAEDPLAVRAVVQALAPGLVRMVRRLEYRGWVAPEGVWPTLSDAAADVVAFTVDVVQGLAGREIAWPQTAVLDKVSHRAESMVRRWRRWGAGQLVFEFPQPEPVRDAASELAELLAAAVEAGRVSAEDAQLIWRHRVRDEPATVIALERGCSAVMLRARRQRAERALAAVAETA